MARPIVVGVTGFMGSGKDTVADFLKEHGFKRASFANALKDIVARLFGWDRAMLAGLTKETRAAREVVDSKWAKALGMPKLTPRRALQLWGTEVVRDGFHPNFWVQVLQREIESGKYGDRVVVTDCRFPNEVEMIHSFGGKVWRIQRGATPEWETKLAAGADPETLQLPHRSEWSWIGLEDVSIWNNGTLESLRTCVDSLVPPS